MYSWWRLHTQCLPKTPIYIQFDERRWAASEAGTAYPSRALEFPQRFRRFFVVAQSLVWCIVYCQFYLDLRSWLHLWFIQIFPDKFEGFVVAWSHCSWVYNYLCNWCLSPMMLWVRITYIYTWFEHIYMFFYSETTHL